MRLIFPVAALVGVIVLTGCTHTSSSHGKGPAAGNTYSLTFDQVREAAQDGDADAQYALGYMYYYGQNVTRNGNQARFWIGRAASQHHQQAIRALNMMNADTQVASREPSSSRVAESSPGRNIRSGQGWQEVRRAQENTPAQPVKNVVFTKPQATANSAAGHSNQTFGNETKPANKKYPTPEVYKKSAKRSLNKGNAAKAAIEPSANKASAQKGPKNLSADERGILSKPNNHYTLQLFGSGSKGSVQQVLNRNHLQNKAKVYQTEKNGKDFYVLIYGSYPSQEAANAALARLPANIKQLKPWAKSFAAVKANIQSAGGSPVRTSAHNLSQKPASRRG